MASVKLKVLEEYLQEVEGFSKPNIELEQYITPPHIAACCLHTIESSFGDIERKVIADLGTGCGMLCFGAAILGADYCIGFDIDDTALEIFQENREQMEFSNCDAVQIDLLNANDEILRLNGLVDTVIMNPPFGTRKHGVDMEFVKVGLTIAPIVYSLHKSSTRDYVIKKATKDWNVKCQVIAELRYNLNKSFKFHKKNSVDINVDLIRFNKVKCYTYV